MRVSILGDHHDTLRTLRCFSKLGGHAGTVWNDHVQDVDALVGGWRLQPLAFMLCSSSPAPSTTMRAASGANGDTSTS